MADRVVLGFGGTVDYELEWDHETLQRLVDRHGISRSELSLTRPVVDEYDVLVVVLAMMAQGTGGERFVDDREALVAFAKQFPYRVTLGGTNVRAAIALDKLGIESVVQLVSIDDDVRRLLPGRVRAVCSAEEDSTNPHVIVQYPAGAHVTLVGGEVVVSPRPNRVILVNDPPNRELRVSPEIAGEIAQAAVVMVSGFNAMQDPAVLEERIAQVQELVARRQPGSVLYYEDAAHHREDFLVRLVEGFASRVDVWSMNEDEAQHHLRRRIDLEDPHAVTGAVRDLRAVIPAPTLVVHTRLWGLVAGRDTGSYRDALASGVHSATSRFVHGDGWGRDAFTQVVQAPSDPEALRIARAIEAAAEEAMCIVPVARVAPARPTTIGLGDTFAGGFVRGLLRRQTEETSTDTRLPA